MRTRILMMVWVLLASCGGQEKVPDNILAREQMGNVLFEISMAEAFLENYLFRDSTVNRDSALGIELEKVLLANHITPESFKRSYAWYKQHPAVMRVVVDTVYARSQRSQEKLYGRRPRGKARVFMADTTDTEKSKHVPKQK